MKFEQLEQLLVISQEKSISKAARTLFLGQSTLSNSLHSLEEEIGVCLFERTANGVEATPECTEIIQLAKQILKNRDQILNYKNTDKDLYGTVTVHMVPGYTFLFSDILKRFQKQFPKANLHLEVLSPEEIFQSFQHGKTDIAIILCPREEEYSFFDNSLNFESFGEHNMLLYVGANHPLFQKNQIDFSQIKEEHFLSYSSMVWSRLSSRYNLDNAAVVVQDRESLKRMISDGEAVALLPDTFAKRDLYCQFGMIHPIPVESADIHIMPSLDHLVYPKKRQLTLLEQGTLRLLREIMHDISQYESELQKEEN